MYNAYNTCREMGGARYSADIFKCVFPLYVSVPGAVFLFPLLDYHSDPLTAKMFFLQVTVMN